MELKDYIYKRKSTRKYDMSPLPGELIAQIKNFANGVKPLYENIKTEYIISSDTKNILPVKAPHYFIISSEKKDGYLENVGFKFQQVDLYLSSLGLGSCWLGLARPGEKIDTNLEFVIILAFGKAAESPTRELSGFKRKPISEITNNNNIQLEPARLAPSASNGQPWYFINEGDLLHLYCVKHGLIKSMMYEKMNKVDMGIVLAHLFVSYPEKFEFIKATNAKPLQGYYYFGSMPSLF